jgi:sugar O-acyltransferase (sialic acid O-acetyltransferase NeuD family)
VTSILLLGGGGHCSACIDVIETLGKMEIKGIVHPHRDSQAGILGYPVLGCDDDLPILLKGVDSALVTVGQIKQPDTRIQLFELLKVWAANLPIIVSPLAYCSRHAELGEGTILMHGSVVNTNARIGANCIVNTLALVEHDADIGSHCHISTGARVNGGVRIGAGSFIGSGVVLREGITLGSRVIIGAGQVILKDVPDGTVVRTKRD